MNTEQVFHATSTDPLIHAIPVLIGPFLLVLTLMALLVAGVVQKRADHFRFIRYATAAFLVALAVYTLSSCTCKYGMYLWGSWQSDQPSIVVLSFLLFSTAFILVLYPKNGFEGPFLLFFAISGLLGAWIMVHATHVLTAYLGVELLSMSSYLMVLGSRERNEAPEAGLKFLVQGGFSAAVLLFGFSLLYSASDDLTFEALGRAFRENPGSLMYAGALCTLVGIWFKLALWPVHLWAPGVFAVSRQWMLGYLSIVPKLAGAILGYRWIAALAQDDGRVLLFFAMFGLLALTAGNLGAFRKNNFRTMMAYSSVAQSGFVWVAVVQSTVAQYGVLLFYLLVLTISNLIVWLLYSDLEEHQGDYMPDWKLRSGAWVLTLIALLSAMISFVGIPGTGGFMAKLLLFVQTWELYERYDHAGWVVILVVGLLNSVLSLFYYIRPFYYGVVRAVPSISPKERVHSWQVSLALVLLLVVLFGIFFMPDLVLSIVE